MGKSPYTYVLFDEQVIPNYRIGIFQRLAAYPNIHLTVSYWARRPKSAPPQVEQISGFNTVVFSPIKWIYSGRTCWINIDLFKYVVSKKPDVVIGRFNMFGMNTVVSFVFQRICTFITGTKFVYRVSHGLPKSKGLIDKLLRRIWFKIFYHNAIVSTYGQKAADTVISQGCSSDRVFVEYNSMDTEELSLIRSNLEQTRYQWEKPLMKSKGIQTSGFVLFASRILFEKRLDILIEAWKAVLQQFSDVQLVVVGSGPAKHDAIKKAQILKGRVIFIKGIYNTQELAKYYLLSSIVVFPGYATLSTQFAMCFGKPIVCSKHGNEVEYVYDGINGYIYDYGNIDQLAEKIIMLLENERLRKNFGMNSERLVKEKINVEHMINTINAAINKAIFG